MYIVVVCGIYGAPLDKFIELLNIAFKQYNLGVNVLYNEELRLKCLDLTDDEYISSVENQYIMHIDSSNVTIIVEHLAMKFKYIVPDYKIFVNYPSDLALVNLLRNIKEPENVIIDKFLNDEYINKIKRTNDWIIDQGFNEYNLVVFNLMLGAETAYLAIKAKSYNFINFLSM